jgi:hypothetical protein
MLLRKGHRGSANGESAFRCGACAPRTGRRNYRCQQRCHHVRASVTKPVPEPCRLRVRSLKTVVAPASCPRGGNPTRRVVVAANSFALPARGRLRAHAVKPARTLAPRGPHPGDPGATASRPGCACPSPKTTWERDLGRFAPATSTASPKPVPCAETSNAPQPVVREGGLRVVVAANSFALPDRPPRRFRPTCRNSRLRSAA